MSTVNLSRRKFLKTTAVAGGGLVIGFSLTGCSTPDIPVIADAGGFVPNAFLQITPDNAVKFYCPRDEMGQGISTGLGTLLAEEFDIDPASIEILFAGVHPDYNNPGMGIQATGGSNAMNAHYLPMRQAGANARAIIVAAAAQQLGVAESALTTDAGHVVANGKRHPYGTFVATAAGIEAPTEAPMKSPAEFRYIGKEFPRLDGIAKSTGTAVYGIDVDVPGMHHAVVRRSPVAGASLKTVDDAAAKVMPGVTDVLAISTGVAVVAESWWQAKQAAAALDIDWETIPLTAIDSTRVRNDYAAALDAGEGTVDEEGDVAAGLAAASTVVEGEYWTPFLAHAPLEPMNAVVTVSDDSAEIWSGTQSVSMTRGIVARVAGLDPEQVTSHNTWLGGSFGRRGSLTHVVEATEIARDTRKPIHLLWSREDDLQNGLFRPASLMRIRAGVDGDGRIAAWDAERAGGNITPDTLRQALPGLFPGMGDGTLDWIVGLSESAFGGWVTDGSSIEGLFEDYDTSSYKVTHSTVDHGVPLTFWRSVGHSYTAFAKESMMDELAYAAGQDPVEFRVANSGGNPRLQNVIRVAQEHMAAMKPAPGRHLGFAAHHSFKTDVAEIAEVSVENGQIRVHKVTCVVDCGTAVNPDVVRAQMEGGVMFGLTAALHGELELENGAIKQSNFHDYPILRMNEAPAVDVVIIDSGTEPTGVGEPGLPPIAPAVANAVYAATGQRLRSLPLRLEA